MTKTTGLCFMAALLALPLTGCGAAKSIVNNNIPAVNDLMRLDGQTVDATVGSGRAVISGHGTATVVVPNQSISQANQLGSLSISQAVQSQVTVTVPSGATLPASFSLNNITLALTLMDGTSAGGTSVSLTATTAGPITYTRTSGSTYTTNSTVSFSSDYSGATLPTALAILTAGADPNTATARLSFDTDDTKLPSGSVIRFTLNNGSGKPKL